MKVIIKYSLALTAALIGWDFLFYNYLWKIGSALLSILPSFLITGLFIYTAIRELKIKKYGGEITYMDASLSGFFITACTAIMYYSATYMVFPYGNIIFKDEYIVLAKEKMEQDPVMTEESKLETLKNIETGLTPSYMAQSNLKNVIIYGIIISLLSASIQRKKIDIPPSS